MMDIWTTSSEKHLSKLAYQLSRCAYSMGFCLGDGYLQTYSAQKGGKWYALQVMRMGKPDRDVLERVQAEIEDVFGVKYAITPRILASGLQFYQLHAYRRDIFDFFAINTAMKTAIPEPYFSAPDNIKRDLVAGLMDSDGWISHRLMGENSERWDLGFGSTKRDLVAGLAAIMRSVGVKVGTMGEYKKDDYRLFYRIHPNVRSFVESGCYFHSARKAQKLADCQRYMLGSETLYAAPSSQGEDKVRQVVKAA